MTLRILHKPILVDRIVAVMAQSALVVDATFGAGGHSRALLSQHSNRVVYAMDQDPNVAGYAVVLERDYPKRLVFVPGNFRAMVQSLAKLGVIAVDGVLMDIGVSSMQLDEPHRGFSFREDGALDMRMSGQGRSAEEVVNDYTPQELTRIIRALGEEPMARTIVKNIMRHRAQGRITTTTQLAAIIHEVKQRRGAKIDPATQTFQALRMHVNDELQALQEGLQAAEAILHPGGVLAVLSFHSLEDRVVKRFLQARIQQSQGSRHLPPIDLPQPSFALLHRGVVRASTEELARNPRARSAKLRFAQKLAVGVPC
ncbi:MAG: 16S rRNA (cytosine(1402)-N(4))-methyltransferase RsmH [Alphaproteobacteria bacterium]|nr:16S rRNA (cytosine(1402)-N(4))-methyltransferase RsmH [Alphaproteobacteria bacterium]